MEELLDALGQQLAAAGRRFELVVVGGSGLLALGVISRPTRDVDVLALREVGGSMADDSTPPELGRPAADVDVLALGESGALGKADPLPPALAAARDRVTSDFHLATEWLNTGPAGLMDLGLPEGFFDRVETRSFGESLTVHFASPLDQIHFKLYAVADQGAGKHEQDLRALHPSPAELVQAARWARTQDPSAGFKEMLEGVLHHFGVDDADLGA
jgi:hypothetical protein